MVRSLQDYACSSDGCGGGDPCLCQSELTKPTVADLHDKSGNCLAGYPLHPICLAGPFGKVQAFKVGWQHTPFPL